MFYNYVYIWWNLNTIFTLC